MNDIEKIKATINEWNHALDNGDIDAISCNENQPTTVGVQAIRDKYEPRIKVFTFTSSVDIDHIKVFDNFAVVISHFNVKMTHKETGEKSSGAGRLILGYRRDKNGDWKMVLDIDNND